MKLLISFSLLVLACLSCPAAERYRAVPVVLHVHSTWSHNGIMSVEQIAGKARAAGIRAVILSDHDIVKCSYGVPPFRNFIKRTKEYPSVLKRGPAAYLEEIARVNKAYPEVLLIPGVESTPYYFWTGVPWKADFTLNDWHKHLLVAGIYDPGVLRRLPVLGNEAAAGKLDTLLLWPLVPFLWGILLIKTRRTPGKLLMYAGALGAFINFPYAALPFNQYDGCRSEAPYQQMIDYVAREAPSTGMVFWAHPEAPDFDAPAAIGRVALRTKKYPEALSATGGYTGFGYFQEGDKAVGTAGGVWDRVLTDYVNGKRRAPVWAAGELDYRAEGLLGTCIDSFQNIVLLKHDEMFSPAAIIHALKAGRFYVAKKARTVHDIEMSGFSVDLNGQRAIMGETINGDGPLRLSVTMTAPGNAREKVRLSLIQEGALLRTMDMITPFTLSLVLPAPVKSTYYRVEAAAAGGSRVVTNPIFIESPGKNTDRNNPESTAATY